MTMDVYLPCSTGIADHQWACDHQRGWWFSFLVGHCAESQVQAASWYVNPTGWDDQVCLPVLFCSGPCLFYCSCCCLHCGGLCPRYGGLCPRCGGLCPHCGGLCLHCGGFCPHSGGLCLHCGGFCPHSGGLCLRPALCSVLNLCMCMSVEKWVLLIIGLSNEVQR